MGAVLDAGLGVAQNLINTGMGLALEKHNDKRQLKQQGKLQDLALRGNAIGLEQLRQKEMRMWEDTSYAAQVEQLSKAGLNPALMYGMGGGGGQSTGGGGTGGSQASAPAGGAEIMGMMLGKAQIDLIKAQTDKTKAEIPNVALTGKNIEADTALKEMDWDIKAIEKEIAGETQNAQKAIIFSNLRTITAQMHIAERDQKVSAETAQAAIEQAKTEAAGALIKNQLIEAQTAATNKGNEKVAKEIELLQKEIDNFQTTRDIENWVEKEKIRLMEKGINVAIIGSILSGIIGIGTMGRGGRR